MKQLQDFKDVWSNIELKIKSIASDQLKAMDVGIWTLQMCRKMKMKSMMDKLDNSIQKEWPFEYGVSSSQVQAQGFLLPNLSFLTESVNI